MMASGIRIDHTWVGSPITNVGRNRRSAAKIRDPGTKSANHFRQRRNTDARPPTESHHDTRIRDLLHSRCVGGKGKSFAVKDDTTHKGEPALPTNNRDHVFARCYDVPR
jgi:hypothetical protein